MGGRHPAGRRQRRWASAAATCTWCCGTSRPAAAAPGPLAAVGAAAGPRREPSEPDPAHPQPRPGQQALPFLLHAPDRFALAAVLSRLADIAGWLSDAEMQDLACLLGRDTGKQGIARVALVATRQEQLALLAREAVTMLPHLADGLLAVRPGIFAADDADGRVTLLLSGRSVGARAGETASAVTTAVIASCLDTLRWLEALDVQRDAPLSGTASARWPAWPGPACSGEAEVVEIAELRAQFLRIRLGGARSRLLRDRGCGTARHRAGRQPASPGPHGDRPDARRTWPDGLRSATRSYRAAIPVRPAAAAADLDVDRCRDLVGRSKPST